MRNILPGKGAKNLVHACVTFQPVHCNLLLSLRQNISLKSAQMTQTATARVLMGMKKSDHMSPLLASHDIQNRV